MSKHRTHSPKFKARLAMEAIKRAVRDDQQEQGQREGTGKES